MPSQKILEQKKALVADIKNDLENSKSAVLVESRGLTVGSPCRSQKRRREVHSS